MGSADEESRLRVERCCALHSAPASLEQKLRNEQDDLAHYSSVCCVERDCVAKRYYRGSYYCVGVVYCGRKQ